MDIIDHAQQVEQTGRDRAIRSARRAVDQAGTSTCVSCGEPIPAARRKMMPAASRCIECQEQVERRSNGR